MYKKIGDIFHPGVHSVQVGESVEDALGLMRQKSFSCVVVLDGDRLEGIFTERDVVRYIATVGQSFARLSIQEVMTPNVITVTRSMYFFEAFNILTERRIRHLVVVDDQGVAIGVLTQTDMVEHFGYDYFIKVKTVEQVMVREICSIGKGATLYEAAKVMSGRSVSCLVVVDDCCNPVGMITERDMAKAVAQGDSVQETLVGDIMSSPVITVVETMPAYNASRIMQEHHIRRLVVVDHKERPIGVLTQSDMVRGLESKYIDMLKTIIKEQGVELDKTVQLLAQKTLYLDCILSTSIHMGIVACDENLIVTYFNPAAEKIFGLPSSGVIGRNVSMVHQMMDVDCERFEKARSVMDESNIHSFTFIRESGIDPGKRRYINGRMSSIKNSGKLIGYVLMLEDVSEEVKAHETITRLAYYDVLTDLPNRALFNDRLASEFARSRRHGRRFALIVMDVDGFKNVNDTHGHNVGDALLQAIAGRLQGVLRDSDTVARIGGDEFCFIVSDLPVGTDLVKIAQKVLDKLDSPVVVGDCCLEVGYSLGIAVYPEHGENTGQLMSNADRAMYRSKRLGKEQGGSHISIY